MADPDLRSQLSAGYWDRVRKQSNIGRTPPPPENIGAPPPSPPTEGVQEYTPPQPVEGIKKFANGGMVKHGSSTRVSCKTKG